MQLIKLTDSEKLLELKPSDSDKIITVMKLVLSRELELTTLPPLAHNKQDSTYYRKLKSRRRGVMTDGSNLLDSCTEYAWILGLRADNRLQFIDLISIGGKRSSSMGITESFRGFGYYDAVQAILVHNHPCGGLLKFSPEDIATTKKLMRVAHIFDCVLSDHIIINEQFDGVSLRNSSDWSDLTKQAYYEEYDNELNAKMIVQQEKELLAQHKQIAQLKEQLAKFNANKH
jgi:DNA repair protein RadC